MKVTIESITGQNSYGDLRERTRVLVDGKEIGKESYGGEPEDNARFRDYKWVEPLLAKLASALGADVETVKIKAKDEDEED